MITYNEGTIDTNIFGVFTSQNGINLNTLGKSSEEYLKVNLYSTCAEIELLGGIKRLVSFEDLRSLILSKLGEKQDITSTLLLPPGCMEVQQSRTELSLYCYYPEQIQKVTHHTTKYTIPFPALLLYFPIRIESDRHVLNPNDVRYAVVKQSLAKILSLPSLSGFMKNKTNFGLVPFPNFSTSYSLCFGQNIMPGVFKGNNLRSLSYYYQIIFDSAFNNDYGITGVKYHYEPKEYFKHLSKLTAFPYEELE